VSKQVVAKRVTHTCKQGQNNNYTPPLVQHALHLISPSAARAFFDPLAMIISLFAPAKRASDKKVIREARPQLEFSMSFSQITINSIETKILFNITTRT